MKIDGNIFEIEPFPNQLVCFTVSQAREIRHFLNNHKMELRPNKDWSNCPYESHADDCHCRGEGGDR